MAATNLSAATQWPLDYTQVLATTWKQVILPDWCTAVDVRVAAAAGRVGFIQVGITGPETPAEAGAVGTHFAPVSADVWTRFEVQPSRGNSAGKAQSIFIASVSGTPTAYLVLHKL